MPTYPIVQSLISATPLTYFDEQFVSQFDGGVIATRSRYLNRRASIQLSYLVANEGLVTLSDFFDEVRGATLTFDFTYPYPHTGVSTTAATPVVATTPFSHGYRTGEQIDLQGVAPGVDGVYPVTKLSATTFSLDGSSSIVTSSTATVARHFPAARFGTTQFGPFTPQRGFGAPANDSGMIPVVLTINEI